MKKLKFVIAILLMIVMVTSIDMASSYFQVNRSENAAQAVTDNSNEDVFAHDEVIDVNIEIDEDIYEEMIANAMEEEYVTANITYDGYTCYNVAIRPKGNSSLQSVVKSDSNRYSFKVDFNKYVDGQNLFGISKLNLNNIFSDPSLMAEYTGYEMLDDIDAVSSETTYIALSINDEYFGLYLAVEEIDENFLEKNYGNFDGQLYKPEGTGADLAYISDDPKDYTGIVPQDDDRETDENFIELVKTIDQIIVNNGETDQYNLSNILNMDSFLKYLAFSTATVHMDTYQSGMNHNYYLYFNTDTEKFEWISWDLNMIFNGFPRSNLTDEEATQFLIDEPVIGQMANYPLVEAVFTNESYVEKYHEYLEEIITGYLSDDSFQETVLESYEMIEPYASTDPSAFYSIDQVKESIFDYNTSSNEISLLEFIELRIDNIASQLSGELTSTNDGMGNGSSGTAGGMDRGNRPGGMNQENMANPDMDGQVMEGQEERQRPVRMDRSEGMALEEGMTPEEGTESQEMMQRPADREKPAEMEMAEGTIPEDGVIDDDRMAPAEEGMAEPEGMEIGQGNSRQGVMQGDGDMQQEAEVDTGDIYSQLIAIGLGLSLTFGFSIFLSKKY